MTGVASIVLAAGGGSRFGAPKQFEMLGPDLTLVAAAVKAAQPWSDELVLVLPQGADWDGDEVDHTVVGGSTRLESVSNGLRAIESRPRVVIVHDAAHPLAPQEMFPECIQAIEEGADAAVPMLPVADVIKRYGPDGLVTVGRDGLGLSQVPMAFSFAGLTEAHRSATGGRDGVWEDSALIEQMGGRVVATNGSIRNIHVVTEEDLHLARLIHQGAPDRSRDGRPD